MTSYAPFVISGLVVGAVYAIAALGLVVTYRTTGVLNFAHGAVAMTVAYAWYEMRVHLDIPTFPAIVLALGVVAPAVGLIVDRVLFRRLDSASQASKIVVSLGLLTFLQGAVAAIFGGVTKNVQPFLPLHSVKIGSVYVGYDQMITVALSVVILVGLVWFFRRFRIGVAMRAVVDDRDLAAIAGFEPSRITLATWTLGVVLAGGAGILFSPLIGLDTTTLTLLVIQCYAAALFGRLTSLPRTYVAALGLGIVGNLILKAFASHPNLLTGSRQSLPFVLLLAVLVFAKRGTLRELGVSAPWAGTARTAARGWWLIPPVLAVVALVIPSSRILSLAIALVLACSLLSITALTGSSGLLSLTQAGLAGIGAFTYLHLTAGAHVPFGIAVIVSGLVVIPVGVAIAIPALRLPSLFLALATFGFGELIDGLLFTTWHWFSGGGDGLRGSRPSLLSGDRAYTLFLVAMLAVFLIVIAAMRRRALGRTLHALRDSSAAAEALGVNPLWPKVAIFSLSALMAGVSGALYAGLLSSASTAYFNVFTSLLWVTIAVVGGVDSVFGAVIGAMLFGFAPTLFAVSTSATIIKWLAPAFGVGAIVLARQPGGLAALIGQLRRRPIVGVADG
jgi:branched-subunit amino acid ABC-type transport system permease component